MARDADRLLQVRLNQDLLELYTGALNPWQDISTPIVQHFDQRARWNWMLIWLGVLGVGLVGTTNLNSHACIFRYYRRQIKRYFLDERESGEAIELSRVQTWSDGRPYPLIMSAWMKPEWLNGMHVEPRPLVFTPNHVSVEDDGIHVSSTGSYNVPGIAKRMGLNDAIAISGSAVTPWMTNNIFLATIMDFFGLRLGQWLPMPGFKLESDSTSNPNKNETKCERIFVDEANIRVGRGPVMPLQGEIPWI